jgi:hypothetical protein
VEIPLPSYSVTNCIGMLSSERALISGGFRSGANRISICGSAPFSRSRVEMALIARAVSAPGKNGRGSRGSRCARWRRMPSARACAVRAKFRCEAVNNGTGLRVVFQGRDRYAEAIAQGTLEQSASIGIHDSELRHLSSQCKHKCITFIAYTSYIIISYKC